MGPAPFAYPSNVRRLFIPMQGKGGGFCGFSWAVVIFSLRFSHRVCGRIRGGDRRSPRWHDGGPSREDRFSTKETIRRVVASARKTVSHRACAPLAAIERRRPATRPGSAGRCCAPAYQRGCAPFCRMTPRHPIGVPWRRWRRCPQQRRTVTVRGMSVPGVRRFPRPALHSHRESVATCWRDRPWPSTGSECSTKGIA